MPWSELAVRIQNALATSCPRLVRASQCGVRLLSSCLTELFPLTHSRNAVLYSLQWNQDATYYLPHLALRCWKPQSSTDDVPLVSGTVGEHIMAAVDDAASALWILLTHVEAPIVKILRTLNDCLHRSWRVYKLLERTRYRRQTNVKNETGGNYTGTKIGLADRNADELNLN